MSMYKVLLNKGGRKFIDAVRVEEKNFLRTFLETEKRKKARSVSHARYPKFDCR